MITSNAFAGIAFKYAFKNWYLAVSWNTRYTDIA